MKKTFFIVSAILSLSLLSACGSSGDIAPSTEAPTEQVSTEENSSTAEDEINHEQTKKVQEPADEVETDELWFYVIHSIREPGSPVKYYYSLPEKGEYDGFGTGILFLDDGYQSPYWLQKESPDSNTSSPVHIEGETGESIQKSFEDMYTKDLSSYDSFFEEKFNELAEEVVNSKCHNYDELYKISGMIDVTDSVPKELTFKGNSGEEIKLPIVSASLRNDRVDSVPADFELTGPSWNDGEKRYGLSNMMVIFNIPADSLDELRGYLFERIRADAGDSNNEQVVVADDKKEMQSAPILEGKNFDNVTGFEGYWYDKTTGELDFVLFSDGTALETDNYGGNVYLVDYSVSMEWKMVYIYGVNDEYFCEIINSDTLGGDVNCIRKPYEGGLENLTFKTKNW